MNPFGNIVTVRLAVGTTTATFPGDAQLVDFTLEGVTGSNGGIVFVSFGRSDPDALRTFEIINAGGTLSLGFERYGFVGRVFRAAQHWLLFEVRG